METDLQHKQQYIRWQISQMVKLTVLHSQAIGDTSLKKFLNTGVSYGEGIITPPQTLLSVGRGHPLPISPPRG